MMLRATIGGLVFEDRPTDYDQCYLISPQGMSGWESGVAVRREELARPLAHGAFDAAGYMAARVVSIQGTILARTQQELRHMVTRLTGLLADGSSGRLVVQDDLESTWAKVRLAAATQVVTHGSTGREAEFQVQFWAPNPHRFGQRREFTDTTSLYVHHRGNTNATPVVEVTGTLPAGYVVEALGKQYTVEQALTSGQTHRIDMGTGWLQRNGALQVGQTATVETFTIPPGTPTLVEFTPVSGSGTIKVTMHDTFV